VSTGEASVDDDAASKAQMEKTEISLTLSNKFEVPEHEQSDAHSQLIRSDPVLFRSSWVGQRSLGVETVIPHWINLLAELNLKTNFHNLASRKKVASRSMTFENCISVIQCVPEICHALTS